MMMVFPMVYTAIVTPYFVASLTDAPRPVFWLDRAIDVLFVIDMVRCEPPACAVSPALTRRPTY